MYVYVSVFIRDSAYMLFIAIHIPSLIPDRAKEIFLVRSRDVCSHHEVS